MNGKLIGWIGTAFMASMLWVPASAYGWGGTLTITYNSIHCIDLVTGGTRQTINDGAASCTILIKEISTQCRNKKGNADPARSHIFRLNPTEISKSQSGQDFRITKNGETLSDIFFNEDDIKNAVGDQLTLDPAVLCPNRNWSILKWAVTRFDMIATVNGVREGYKPFFPTGADPFVSCNPAFNGLSYTNGTVDPTAGILGECWLFRNQFVAVDSFFIGQDKGGVAFLDPTFTADAFYNGVCQDHGKQGGSIGNVGAYHQIGPAADDPECTGNNTVLDGSY